MPVDYAWIPGGGGILLDGTGDIAITDPTTHDDIMAIVRSRLAASLNGFQLYSIGADLENVIGTTYPSETGVEIQRQIIQSLSGDGFVSKKALAVQTILVGTTLQVLVYLNGSLLTQASVSNVTSNPVVSIQ